MRFTPIAADQVVLAASPDLPGFSAKLDKAALARVPLILREEGSGTRTSLKALGLARATRAVQVGSNEAARRCALERLGYAFLSQRVVADDVAAGRLALVSAPGLPVKRTFFAATLKGVALTPASRALFAQLKP